MATILYLMSITLVFVLTESHPCDRECSRHENSTRICYYNFVLTTEQVLSPKFCSKCPTNRTDCFASRCVPADGSRPRQVSLVNKVFPGPSIRVCHGDRIMVDVTNKLALGQGTAIHWHGLHQKGSNWMDGVPSLTQCEIPTGTKFRYQFDTTVSGTHFWHSHKLVQRGDGLAGGLIIRTPKDEGHGHLYDFDLPEHELFIQDWFPELMLASHINGPSNILINGKGLPARYFDKFKSHETIQSRGKPFAGLHHVQIGQNSSYRFRLISNGVADCPIEMSIEDHTMTVIATDGFDIKPIDGVQSLVIFAGERYDFIIRGNQPLGSYWIKFRGLLDCKYAKTFQVAVLNYFDATANGKGEREKEGKLLSLPLPPHSIKSWAESAADFDAKLHKNGLRGLQVNPLNMAAGFGVVGQKKFRAVSEFFSNAMDGDDDPQITLQDKADHQFYLSYDVDSFSHLRTRKNWGIGGGWTPLIPQFNFISHTMPVSPPLVHPEEIRNIKKCQGGVQLKMGGEEKDCSKFFCQCTHWLTVRLNSIVEFVLVDRGYHGDGTHPFHLHGHSFRVVAMERLNQTTEPWIIKERDEKGLISRKRLNAPIKDTVSVPNGGYTILRFRADNPGFWLFHCHMTFHAFLGMELILQVGELHQIPRPPPNFPRCRNKLF